MFKRFATVLSLLVLFPLAAQALDVGVRGYYWFPSLEASARVGGGGLAGTKLDLKDDLGMDNESYPAVEAFLGLGRHHLSLSALHAAYEGEESLGSVSFNGETFDGTVESEFDFTMLDLAYQYDVLDLENILAGFSLGPILQVKHLSGDVWLKDVSSGLTEEKDFSLFIPMIGAGAHIGLLADWIEARAKVVGIGYSGNRLIDGLAEIVVTPFPLLDIGAGYRHIELVVDENDVEIDASFSGPYATLSISW